MEETMEKEVISSQISDRDTTKEKRDVRRYAFFTSDEVDRLERVMRYASVDEDRDVTWTDYLRDLALKRCEVLERKYKIVK